MHELADDLRRAPEPRTLATSREQLLHMGLYSSRDIKSLQYILETVNLTFPFELLQLRFRGGAALGCDRG